VAFGDADVLVGVEWCFARATVVFMWRFCVCCVGVISSCLVGGLGGTG